MDLTTALSQVNWSDPWSIGFGAVIVAHVLAKAYVASTDTPSTDTVWGKVYMGIELLAGVVGKIKQKNENKDG